MNTSLVKVIGLHRHFGDVHAVNNVSFSLNKGQVVGLIGANGAGKTTLMRMIATLDSPDKGDIFINGIHAIAYPQKVRSLIGWMPDDFRPYTNTTVRDYLDFFARAYDLGKEIIANRVDEVMEFTDLKPLEDRMMDKLSKGQTQRLCLARTLISDPPLLILDEPAAGLDPKARLEFKNLVRILQERDKTILISSHILSELGEMCNSLIFMDSGKIVHEGGKQELLEKNQTDGIPFEIKIIGEINPLVLWLEIRRGWKLIEQRKESVLATFDSPDPESISEELARLCSEFRVFSFHREERRLEDAFIDLLRDRDNDDNMKMESISISVSQTTTTISSK